MLSHRNQPSNIVSVLQESRPGASGSRMQHLVLQRTKTMAAYQRSFLKSFALHLTLSDSKLLERCVLGTTQNANECVNSMVWVWCPKHKHHGVKVVRCAVASAVCHFHSGARSRLRIMERLSIPGGASTRLASNVKGNKRKRKSDLQATAKEKKCHQGEQLLRTRREKALS